MKKFFIPLPRRPLGILTLTLTLLGGCALLASCGKKPGSGPFSQKGPAGSGSTPTEYMLDSQPFSPTLPYLFDGGRIVVLPAESLPKPPENSPAEGYAFSGLDRFGRLYHFDAIARWWMGEGQTLPDTLPMDNWDAVWNPAVKAVEALVTAPFNGEKTVQILRWREGRWTRLAVTAPPAARYGAYRLFSAASGHWIFASGQIAGKPAGEAWTFDGVAWKKWGVPAAGPAPDLSQTAYLIDGPASEGVALLTQPAGDIWIWKGGLWTHTSQVKMENLCLAQYVPAMGQVLFVWARGVGQDQFLWQPFKNLLKTNMAVEPENLNQTAMVRINEEEEGVWKGWGRVRDEKDAQGQPKQVFEPGFKGKGEPAIRLSGEYSDITFRRNEIKILEMPPSLKTVRTRATAYVPALGGLVVPSIAGLGLDAQRQPFFPPEANEAVTSATQPMIDVIERNYRFWIFKEKWLEFLKPPFEIHPAIDFPISYNMPDGRRRCLAWAFPDQGQLRYEFYEFHNQKVQWIHSPLLTLHTLPQLALTPGDTVYACDPVVWGDPAEIIVIGWCGRLGHRVNFDKSPEGMSDEAFTQVPERGFMARISALTPEEWKVTPLDIPFCQGAQLMVAPAQNSLYLLGGKMAEAKTIGDKNLSFMVSHPYVWHWDGEGWRRIDPEGFEPRNKATSHISYDPVGRQLLSLTPRALYGFDSDKWHSLWQRDKVKGERWPDEVGLYVHPQSHLILGALFMPQPSLRVWKEERWIPVRIPQEVEASLAETSATTQAGGALPNVSDNLVPSTEPDTFISLDAVGLSAIRMDAQRNRSEDHLLPAHWLSFRPANQGTIKFSRSTLPLEQAAATPDLAPQQNGAPLPAPPAQPTAPAPPQPQPAAHQPPAPMAAPPAAQKPPQATATPTPPPPPVLQAPPNIKKVLGKPL